VLCAASNFSATLGRRAPLSWSHAPFAASSCSATPWTPRATHFEPRALCSFQLLGDPLDAARRSLRASCLLQSSCSATLGRRAPLTSSRATFAALSCSATSPTPRAARFKPRALCRLELIGDPWIPRAAHFEPRALCSLELLGDPKTPRAAYFEPRVLCSLALFGPPLDAARR